MGSGALSNTDEELRRLKAEHEKLLEAYGRLKWAVEGIGADLRLVLGTTPLRARVIAVMLSGRPYSCEQLLHAAWDNDSDVGTVKQTFFHMKRDHPWFAIENVAWGTRGKHALYRMKPETIEYVKRRLAEYEN
jgi:hypothetical protein